MAYDFVLGPDEKREILRIARATLSAFIAVSSLMLAILVRSLRPLRVPLRPLR